MWLIESFDVKPQWTAGLYSKLTLMLLLGELMYTRNDPFIVKNTFTVG